MSLPNYSGLLLRRHILRHVDVTNQTLVTMLPAARSPESHKVRDKCRMFKCHLRKRSATMFVCGVKHKARTATATTTAEEGNVARHLNSRCILRSTGSNLLDQNTEHDTDKRQELNERVTTWSERHERPRSQARDPKYTRCVYKWLMTHQR